MLRKLIFICLLGAGIAYVLRMREHDAAEPPPGASVVPDTSDEDPLVRTHERLAAQQAGEIGGGAPAAPQPDVEPELRPVVEGAGDSEEAFEQEIEDEGR